MTSRMFLFFRLSAAVMGMVALWWFVMPADPEAAMLDSFAAAAVAYGIEAIADRISV